MPHRVAWPWVTWHLWALIIVSKRKLMRLLAKGRPIKVKNKVLAVLPIPQDLALETDEAHTLARLREFPLKIYGQYFPLPSRQVAIKTLQLIQVSKLFLTVLVWILWICFCARTNIPAATARCYSCKMLLWGWHMTFCWALKTTRLLLRIDQPSHMFDTRKILR